jgi:hypothetical protein
MLNATNEIIVCFIDISDKAKIISFFINSTTYERINTTNEISSLGENFDKLTEDIADPWMNIQDKIIEIGEKLSKAIFTINFIFSAIIITLLFFHYFEFLKALFCLFKIFYYISWNLLFLFSIIIFILSGLIGIIGIFGRDCASVGHYIFSDNNLKSETPRILKNGKSSEYLNVCINGNGDLKTAFGFDDSMDKLYRVIVKSE